jgi:hypothetical protein
MLACRISTRFRAASPEPPGPQNELRADLQPACRSARTENNHEPTHERSPVSSPEPTHADAPLHGFRRRSRTPAWRSPVWTRGRRHSRTARNVPRTITTARMGEALFDRQDLQRLYPLRTFRERSRAHAWAKPCLAGRTYNACGALAFRERLRTYVWAKPCLAGRPTALVRTQYFEQNTSRSRPSGMELPDYPVVVLTPSRRTRMGPHFTIPPGLLPDP